MLQTILIEGRSDLVCILCFEESLLLSFERTEALLQLFLLVGQSMLSGIEYRFLHCYPLFADAHGLFPGRGRGLLLPELGLGEGQELLDVGKRPRKPWLRARRLLLMAP